MGVKVGKWVSGWEGSRWRIRADLRDITQLQAVW